MEEIDRTLRRWFILFFFFFFFFHIAEERI
jgi:hypothetical protein